ncbi:hypothetical protein Tco_1023613 [Tanacetum coccineum]
MILRPCGQNYDYVIHNMPTTYKDFKGHQRVSCDVAPWYNGLGMAILAIVAPLAPGVKPLVTTNEQPSVEATHKDEAPVVILTRAFRGVDKATLAFGKAHCHGGNPTCVDWWMDVAHDPRAPNDCLGIGQDKFMSFNSVVTL